MSKKVVNTVSNFEINKGIRPLPTFRYQNEREFYYEHKHRNIEHITSIALMCLALVPSTLAYAFLPMSTQATGLTILSFVLWAIGFLFVIRSNVKYSAATDAYLCEGIKQIQFGD